LVSLQTVQFGDKTLRIEDLNAFLREQMNRIQEKFKDLSKMFPSNNSLITSPDAFFITICIHARKISQHYSDGVNHVEQMLYRQLNAAIGKEVTPVDFYNYMIYHNRKLFKEQYQPIPFCYAIRQPDHFPEGTISIEQHSADGSIGLPIQTIVRRTIATHSMKFNISAATEVEFFGDRYIHSYISHQFSGYSGTHLDLIARARQFSSFIIIVGKIISSEKFDPKCAIIIKNKDELKIPLSMTTIPTSKEFRDAIESLSPEQQRFAKAIRSMQLASTLFGIVVLQIKPQLEKLLKIPHDSLSKEIKLTQDLMDLFITYQIPSDLLSYGGDPDASKLIKLNKIKEHVAAMQQMITNEKNKEFKDASSVAAYQSYSLSPRSRSAQPGGMAFGSIATTTTTTTTTTSSIGGTVPVPEISNNRIDRKLSVSTVAADDYTLIPVEMDRKLEALDTDGAMRPTIVDIGLCWKKNHKNHYFHKWKNEIFIQMVR